MAERKTADAPEARESTKPAKRPATLIIVIVLCSVVSLAVSILALRSRTTGHAARERGKKAAGDKTRARYDLGEFLVNLADSDAQAYVKATIVLEYEEEGKKAKGGHGKEGEGARTEWDAPVRDGIIGILSQCRRSDLRSAKGKDKLKKHILARINDGEISDAPEFVAVYFTSFTMQ